jgi:4-diphosphocytidyl-2-C-methyl-D-erythritol kinase
MKELRESAWAKLNLTLDILGRRNDGYHELNMVMQSVSLCDEVTLTLTDGDGIRLATEWGFLPTDGKNTAIAAALVFARAAEVDLNGLRIGLDKRIPVCAGTAGGSSDAAAVLRGLNRMLGTGFSLTELAKLGEEVGSDVPYCVLGGTMLAQGRGEVLTALPPLPDCHIVLCKPAFSVSTGELFHRVDSVRLRCRPDTEGLIAALERGELGEVARRMYNVFSDALPDNRQSVVAEIQNALIQEGALGACLSGTGPTVFGLFEDRRLAERASAVLGQSHRETHLVVPIGPCEV